LLVSVLKIIECMATSGEVNRGSLQKSRKRLCFGEGRLDGLLGVEPISGVFGRAVWVEFHGREISCLLIEV